MSDRRRFKLASLCLGTVMAFGACLGTTSVAWMSEKTEMTRNQDSSALDIMHRLRIHASPEQVYRAITTAEGIRNWWTRDAALDAKAGGFGEFGFFDRRFVAKVKVNELKPPVHMGWEVVNAAWDGNTIVFDLQADGSDTILSFAHRGFKRADERFASVTTRWGYYLVSLKQYLETGKGTPNPDEFRPVAKGRQPISAGWR